MNGRRALDDFARRWQAESSTVAMRRACRALLAETGQAEPPIQLRPVWRRLGAHVEYDLDDGDGLLDDDGRRWLVRVRRYASRLGPAGKHPMRPASWRRARFTIAHELGHLILLQSVEPSLRPELADPRTHREVERLCNLAAAELLMPERGFKRAAAGAGFSSAGLRNLYDDYLVSWPALLFRLAEVFSANVTVWQPALRRGDGELMRVHETYGAPTGPLWLPAGISERALTQPVVRVALRDGVAACRRLEVPERYADRSVRALACVLPRQPPSRRSLPRWHGATVVDDGFVHTDPVALMALDASARRSWEALVRCRALDWRTRARVAAPLAMRLETA